MAINFPDSPFNGDVFGNYTYDTSIPGWRKTPENSASLPAGTIVQWPGATAPANWLLADGAAVSRTTYASLFAAIGVQYGSGDGTTTFNLPNLKGKVAVGLDSSQTEFNTLGETGGAKTHTLTSSEMPSHTHSFSGTTNTTGSHVHQQSGKWSSYTSHNHYSVAGTAQASDPSQGDSNSMGNTYAAGDHSHTISGTTGTAGSGSAHNNLQPYIVLNYIIKTSAGITSGDSELATRVGVVENANNLTPLSQNYIINGAMDFWQRGTSISVSANGTYTADRWIVQFNGSGATRTVSQQAFTPGAAPVAGYEGTYFLRFAQSVAGSGGTFNSIGQRIEDVRTLAGQTVTVSFWAKAASTITIPNITLWQNFGSGGSGTVGTDFASSLSIGTSWARYSYTVTLPSISGKTIGTSSYLHLEMYQPVNQTFTLDLWGVQVEAGSYATPFRRNAPSIQAELSACQRYYETFQARKLNNENYASSAGYGYYRSINWLVEKRVVPTVTLPATTAKNTSSEAGTAFTDGYSYQFASNAAGNFYMLWNAGLIGTASAEL